MPSSNKLLTTCRNVFVRPVSLFFQKDFDDVFAYSTVRMTQIRDKRLGFIHYFFMSAIVVYILGINIIYNKAYLSRQPIGGATVHLSVHEPVGEARSPPQLFPYCNQSLVGHQTYKSGKMTVRPCRYRDQFFSARQLQSSVFLTTQAQIYPQVQKPGCVIPMTQNCQTIRLRNESQTFFVAGIENFTLAIDHSFALPDQPNSISGDNLNGRLVQLSSGSRNRIPACVSSPDFQCSRMEGAGGLQVGVKGKRDIVTLQSLLHASQDGHQLDPHERPHGTQLEVRIDYTNVNSNGRDFEYEMSVVRLNINSFTETDQLGNNELWPDTSWMVNRTGILVSFVQTGTYARFDATTLLVQLAGSVGLLAVATTVVDLIALSLMKNKNEYRGAKYMKTQDFSDFDEEMKVKEAVFSPRILQLQRKHKLQIPLLDIQKIVTGAVLQAQQFAQEGDHSTGHERVWVIKGVGENFARLHEAGVSSSDFERTLQEVLFIMRNDVYLKRTGALFWVRNVFRSCFRMPKLKDPHEMDGDFNMDDVVESLMATSVVHNLRIELSSPTVGLISDVEMSSRFGDGASSNI